MISEMCPRSSPLRLTTAVPSTLSAEINRPFSPDMAMLRHSILLSRERPRAAVVRGGHLRLPGESEIHQSSHGETAKKKSPAEAGLDVGTMPRLQAAGERFLCVFGVRGDSRRMAIAKKTGRGSHL